MLRLKQGATDRRLVKKNQVFAAISLDDGSTLQVHLFADQQSRLTDVLNDDRAFLPVRTSDGKYLAIAKSTIKRVVLDEFDGPEHGASDSYRILGLKKGVSLEEVKRAYYELLRTHHPDRIRGLGLGAEYQRLSTRSTVQINQAYTQLLKSFELGGDGDETEVQKQIEAELVEAEIKMIKPNFPKKPADLVTARLVQDDDQSFEFDADGAEVEVQEQIEAEPVEAEIETARPNVPKQLVNRVTAVLAQADRPSVELSGGGAEGEIHKQIEAVLVEAEIETAKPELPKEPAAKPDVPKGPADPVPAVRAQGDYRSFELIRGGTQVEIHKYIVAALVEAGIRAAEPNIPKEPADQVTAGLAQADKASLRLSGDGPEVEIKKQIEPVLVEAENEMAEPELPKEPADQVTAALAQDDDRFGAEVTWSKRARPSKQTRSRGPALPQDWISLVNRWAKAHELIHRVYVFGSRSRGVHRADSDLDLAIILSGDDSDEKLICAIECQRRWKPELQQFLPVQVDLEVDPQPSSIAGRAVQRQGRLIFSREIAGTSEHPA